MILIQKVKDYREIKLLEDPLAVLNIYELVQNDDGERLFMPCSVKEPGWLDQLIGHNRLDNCYYINPNHLSISMEAEINGPIGIALNLTVKLDMQNSDSGKGLADWLAGRGKEAVDSEDMRSFLQKTLTAGILEDRLELSGKSLEELRGLCFGADALRDVFQRWLAVECKVMDAKEILTQTQIERDRFAKKREEDERKHQEELAQKDREREALVKAIEIQKLGNELAKMKAEKTDVENGGRIAMLRTMRDTLLMTQVTDRPSFGKQHVEGEPYPAERLVLKFKSACLELCAKRDVILGRVQPNSDVVVTIPAGAMEERQRQDECGKISRAHSRLEYRGDTVRLKNLSGTNRTYVDGREVPVDGMEIKRDADVGFSSDVSWRMRVQTCTGRLRLPCCDGCNAHGVKSVVLEYPGWTALYKVFVWECCELARVDSRLPNWRVVYLHGAQGSEGAFYLLMENGRIIYLSPNQEITDNGVEMAVEE